MVTLFPVPLTVNEQNWITARSVLWLLGCVPAFSLVAVSKPATMEVAAERPNDALSLTMVDSLVKLMTPEVQWGIRQLRGLPTSIPWQPNLSTAAGTLRISTHPQSTLVRSQPRCF
jgi:hypothetical protein